MLLFDQRVTHSSDRTLAIGQLSLEVKANQNWFARLRLP